MQDKHRRAKMECFQTQRAKKRSLFEPCAEMDERATVRMQLH